MTPIIDRRALLLTGTWGVAALAVPGFAQGSALLAARGFTHSVASGEPGATSMLCWTRYVPAGGGAVELVLEVSESADFRRPVAGGRTITGPWRDHTAKVTATGLKPGRRYHYRFVAPDGTASPVGTTKTLPDAGATRFRAAVFSCSNLGFGWFNAYGHAAARDDLDLCIHLGDYIYEYEPGNYPSAAETIAGRRFLPEREIVALADYRLRYASYRADPDLQALHAKLPWIVSADDHETANDTWEGGAENHQPGEGEWSVRRAAAAQAWREWMPVNDLPWQSYDIGTLATLLRTDTRALGRTHPPETAGALAAADPAKALAAFRDGPWRDPAATMLGNVQEAWVGDALAASVRRGQRWQLVGFGTVMGTINTPAAAPEWVRDDLPDRFKARIRRSIEQARAGLPTNMDSWGGYPAARDRFLRAAQAAGAELVVLSGDSHNGWAFDLSEGGRPAGVEFGGHSVSSPGYDQILSADPGVVAAGLVAASPELRWCDTSRRGYMALTVMPDRVANEWLFVDTVRTRRPAARVGHSATVRRGARRLG